MNYWINLFAGIMLILPVAPAAVALEDWNLTCRAVNTAGFHNDSNSSEDYRAALFNESEFTLEENVVFNRHLLETVGDPKLSVTPDGSMSVDLFLSMQDEDGTEVGLQCHHILANSESGYSCVNTPPSEMLVINTHSMKFTRSSIGGWAFFGADSKYSGDSIFVEYGRCTQGTAETNVSSSIEKVD